MRRREKELMEKIITKEAEIEKAEREIKQNNKRMKNIQKSKTWQYSKMLRKRTSPNDRKELEEAFLDLQKELFETRERLRDIQLDDRNLNSYQIARLVKQAKDNAEIIKFINETLDAKKKHEQNYQDALTFAARNYMNENQANKNFIYSRVLSGMKIEDIPEFIVRAGLTETDAIHLDQAASFRASLTMRMREKQLTGTLPEWLLDNKQDAYQFIDELKVKRPWISDETYALKNIPKQEGIVIKPADGAGSRGVYLIYDIHDIVDIKRQMKLNSWESMLENMRKDLDSGIVEKDEWMTEELILEDLEDKLPASDTKFYCFYGKVGLVLEISRYPELMYAWWTRTGERVRTGKYDGDIFMGNGVTKAEIELAETISKEIPAPFIRIDFLRSENGLVFGEFTPKPGNYDEFDDATDKWLGDLFLEAENRLTTDLLNGKDFKLYKNFQASINQ